MSSRFVSIPQSTFLTPSGFLRLSELAMTSTEVLCHGTTVDKTHKVMCVSDLPKHLALTAVGGLDLSSMTGGWPTGSALRMIPMVPCHMAADLSLLHQ